MYFFISFRLLGDNGLTCADKFNKALSSRSMLCECVTAIDGVGFTTPVGVVVVVAPCIAADVTTVLLVDIGVVGAVVEMLVLL